MTQPTATDLDQKLTGHWQWFWHILQLRRLLRMDKTIRHHEMKLPKR
jgi:hypothetical protein